MAAEEPADTRTSAAAAVTPPTGVKRLTSQSPESGGVAEETANVLIGTGGSTEVRDSTPQDGAGIATCEVQPAKKQKVETAVSSADRPAHRGGKRSNRGAHRGRKVSHRTQERERAAARSDDDSEEDGEEGEEKAASGQTKLAKRKVALLMGYCGTKFRGMQVNPGTRTIEGELIRALSCIGSISEANASDSKKVQLRRTARTDKGVHAAGQVVSMKLVVDIGNFLEKLNAELDDDVRVYDFMRVAKSFHPKNHCASRMYEYFMPTYAMSDIWFECLRDLHGPRLDADGEGETEGADVTRSYAFTPEEIGAIRSFRLPKQSLANLRGYMSTYVGSHNFHNYAPGQKFSDQSSRRFIKAVKVDEPILIGGMEWVSIKINGQSFMLNQIRKMIGLVVLMIRKNVPIDLIPRTFANVNINIPRGPAYPLMLERPVFDPWNQKMKAMGKEDISFERCMEKMQGFKEDHIYPRMVSEERDGNLMANWLVYIESCARQYGFLNSKGEIPQSGVLGTRNLKADCEPAAIEAEGQADSSGPGKGVD